jgi:signal transduction histidine kinase/ActR/RegA family two-component response regulator
MPEVPDEPAQAAEQLGLPRATILVVDDDERNALALTTVLKELDQTLVVANSGEEALRYLLTEDVAVILLDVHMPGMDGYETAELIRARKRTRHIPIVFLTAVFRDDSHLLQAYSAGAVDMVFKPVDPFILKSKVSVFVDLYLKQAEIKREAELRSRLQEENFRVRTEKILAEQALRRSQERQEAILGSLPVCFHARATGPPFAASFVSSNVEQLTGFPAHRFIDDAGFALSRVHPEDVARVEQALRDAVATGAYSCEFRWRCADDSFRVLLDQGVLAAPEQGRGHEIFGTILDVTEHRLLQQQLVQAQKMEAVGQLTGGIAHDFNNLLTVVLGNIDLLGRRFGADERAQRQLAAMRHAAERGQSLTGQLLAFSRRQHLRPETLDVNALVRGFEPLIRRAVGENIVMETTIGEDPAVCEVDASQLETTLLNLAVNARDAMPDGGTLRIAVRRVEHDTDLTIRHSDATPGPWIVLSVDDTGVGMSREVLNRAFEPFFTTKEPGKGSGLGLSQVYGFVRQSGGFVTLTSSVGAGTQLSIYLPPSEKPMTMPRFVPPVEPETRVRSETVLVVEDDPAVLAVAIEMLTDLGYRVITASDAVGALEILRRGRPVDLIFTDVVMAGKTGVQLAEEAQALRPQIKVLLTSGYTGEALARHQPNHAEWPIIAKPFRQPELAASIRKILKSEPLPA